MKKASTIPKTVDEYLAGIPEPARSTLNKIRATIRSCVPAEATETISYRIPVVRYNGALVGFAAFADHCSFYPMSNAVMAQFKSELTRYDTAKGTIHFPPDKPLPATLVKRLVKARLAENESKKRR